MIIDPAELKQRHLQRLKGIRDNKVYIGPQSVGLDITHGCNLTCRYCWSHAPGNPKYFEKSKCFSWERFLNVVSESVDLNVDEILFGGFGEPTQHLLFCDMMRHIEQQPLFIKLYTNGTFPLDYCSDVLRGDHVNIHLSAADRKQYDDLHGKDLFDHVVNNIKRLVSLRDETKPKFCIMINYIINASNINQKQKMQELASQLGVNGVYFEEVAHVSDGEIALAEDLKEGKEKSTLPVCVDGWFLIVAMSRGNLTLCPWAYHLDREVIDKGPLKVGALKQGSLKEVWFSQHMMKMRLLGKHGYFAKNFTACQDCLCYHKNMERLKDSGDIL